MALAQELTALHTFWSFFLVIGWWKIFSLDFFFGHSTVCLNGQQCRSVGPPLWSKLEYLNRYFVHLYRHSWCPEDESQWPWWSTHCRGLMGSLRKATVLGGAQSRPGVQPNKDVTNTSAWVSQYLLRRLKIQLFQIPPIIFFCTV